ncbi:hypothetical protein FHT44_005192 [Mycolicibacterium sp. BK634]|uniref:hypothetical protein n=1 Tax=Mycolicibacterium sp. BK634 TaxID=2587099 RepID=UPI001608BC86|nr:hypothetical protein [Mycolicibacterium sp. BK634]MBB3752680.1 hypothetical protein [Mycolicibacterium sp. BK634]
MYIEHTIFPGADSGYADTAGHPVRMAECRGCAERYGRGHLIASRELHEIDVRFLCRQCGRFIAQSSIREEDYFDPNAYYGVGTRSEYDCKRCGTLQGEPGLAVYSKA